MIRLYKPALVAVVCVTVLSISLLATRGLRKDYSLRAFVASNSPAYEELRQLMDEFVSNEFALIAVRAEDVEPAATMEFVERIASEVAGLPQVQRVTSLADVPALLRRVLGDRLRNHPLFVDNFVSRDGKTLAILLQMSGENAPGPVRRETVVRLREIVSAARASWPEARIVLAGPYVTLIDMYDYVDRDLRVFSTAAFALVVVTLGLVFRRFAPALFALAVSASATLAALGFASALALPTALITQMIVILVVVLSVANCVHLAVAEEEEFVRAPFYDWRERSRRVLGRMAAPCIGVMATTAVGFGSVGISSITPVRNFGLLMVVGLVAALVSSLCVIPWLAIARPAAAHADSRSTLADGLRMVGVWVNPHRVGVLIASLAITLMFAAAIPWLKFESDFVKSFRPESEVRRSYAFIESNLSPTGSMEIVVRRADGASVMTAEAIGAAKTVGERAVATFEPVRKAQTVADILSMDGFDVPFAEIDPKTKLGAMRRLFDQVTLSEIMRNFVNAAETALRINLRVTEGVQVRQKLEMASQLRTMAQDVFGPDYNIQITGLYYFHATLVSELWRDQFRSLGITVAAVFVVLMVTLRSVKVAMIAMIPATLPVVICLGAMGWIGIPVNMTTAMMLSVAMGIAVDDVVHYLWRFRAALRETGDYEMALRTAHGSVGRACVFTTVVLALGFWILTLSEFLPTAYFGGLLGFTMCGALVADLVLLPAMILIFRPFGTGRVVAAIDTPL